MDTVYMVTVSRQFTHTGTTCLKKFTSEDSWVVGSVYRSPLGVFTVLEVEPLPDDDELLDLVFANC